MDYETACKQAATDQGLDPVLSLLTRAGVPHSLDQTGGFCMAVHIPWGENPHRWIWITSAMEWHGSEGYLACAYDNADASEGSEPFAELGDSLPLDELIPAIRDAIAHF